jgi:hypothetical protein
MKAKSSLNVGAAPACRITGARPAGFLRRLHEAFTRSHRRQVDRDITRLLSQAGGSLTDEIERHMMQRLLGRHGFGG